MTNMDTDQFYTTDELERFKKEKEEREQRYQDRLDSEDAAERAKQAGVCSNEASGNYSTNQLNAAGTSTTNCK